MTVVRFSAYDRYVVLSRTRGALRDGDPAFVEVERGERARVIDLMLTRIARSDLSQLWFDLWGVPLSARLHTEQIARQLAQAANDTPPRLLLLRRVEPRYSPFDFEMPELEYSSPLADPARLWIEWSLKDDQDTRLMGLAFTHTGPDGAVRSGRTDQKGKARFEPVPAGNYVFALPENAPKEADETQWLDIELVDERGEPDAGRQFEVYVGDVLQRSGTLDEHGHAHVTNLPLGECKVVILPVEVATGDGGHADGHGSDDEGLDETDHWIELVLTDFEGRPVRNFAYKLTLPDGLERFGETDENGMLREHGITQAGDCFVEFPGLRSPWEIEP